MTKHLILPLIVAFLLTGCTLTFTQDNELPTVQESTITRLKYLKQAETLRLKAEIKEQAIKDLDHQI